MIEKVNPMHPDKVADRIAGALVDYAYSKVKNPRIAVEVLIGHGYCYIIIESSIAFDYPIVEPIVERIGGKGIITRMLCKPQDIHLANNQLQGIRCGDNGIFKGVPLTNEEKELSKIARDIYKEYPSDGKYILCNNNLIICQSNADSKEIQKKYPNAIVNPLGDWIGGINVDSGATNRKLGSDMAQSITGGGLHGKDLSKADVSVNIYAFLKAQKLGKNIELYCAIGDDRIDNIPYNDIVKMAREYIQSIGGFEKFAEWGLY